MLLISRIEAIPDPGPRDYVARGGFVRLKLLARLADHHSLTLTMHHHVRSSAPITSARQLRFQHPRDLRKGACFAHSSCDRISRALRVGGGGTNRAERPTCQFGCRQAVRTADIGIA